MRTLRNAIVELELIRLREVELRDRLKNTPLAELQTPILSEHTQLARKRAAILNEVGLANAIDARKREALYA